MTTFTRRGAALALAATLALGEAGCGAAATPGLVGPCDLVVHALKAGRDVVLEPPYKTTLDDRLSRDDVAISFSGSGWGATKVDMVGPGKSVSGTLEAGRFDADQYQSTVWFADAPGRWRFVLASGPCLATVEVEVGPAP